MSKRNRKRKLESEEETETKWELSNILNMELREEMATMWEIPQIFHFLHLSKEVLNISHLSMYEMERMLAMPRASKQLATIMTALLGPPLPKGKIKKVPPMPYDFWVNVLTHKVQGWFKVYQSKHQDIVKVFESIGVEPEFWRYFPEVSIIDQTEFDQLSFKQRVWILKTLCDTLVHSRKTIQDEMWKQMTEDTYEVVLGSDKFGAKFIYFPLFLENDLRVYRHSIDNTILSTVKPPPWTEGQPSARHEKNSRGKRKRSRWKNGALPRDRKRPKKPQEEDVKTSCDSALGSSLNEDTNLSGTSSCSNNNNIVTESGDRNRSRSPSKTSELSSTVSAETRLSKKSSGYDTNTSTNDGKSLNEVEPEEMFRGFESHVKNKNSNEAIGNIHEILTRLTSNVSETLSNENSMEAPNTEIESSGIELHDDDEVEEKKDEDALSSSEAKYSDDQRPDSRAESDDIAQSKCSTRSNKYSDPETFRKEMTIFSSMLADLSSSTFELAADSIDSLRDLANTLRIPDETRKTHVVPKCELALASTLHKLAESLSHIEPKLRESTKKARTKLRKEFINYREGIIEDQETSGDVDRGSNGWIIGSQGCPLLSSSETTLQEIPDAPLSPAGAEDQAKIEPKNSEEGERDSAKPEINEDGGHDEEENCTKREDGIQAENKEPGENDDDGEDSEPQTRRVLRARGISSYMEQLSSSEEEAYELEEWPHVEAIHPAASTSIGGSGIGFATKGGSFDQSAQKNTDKDWILPGARKRKHKSSALLKKTKTTLQRASLMTGNSQDSISSVSPPMPENLGGRSRTNERKSTDNTFICKVESVHSELDIKYEGPIYDFRRNNSSGGEQQNKGSTVDQSPAIRAAGHPRLVRPLRAPTLPNQVPPGYYVQPPQNYVDPRFVRYGYGPRGGGSLSYAYQQPGAHPPPPRGYPVQARYWAPPNFQQLPPGAFPAGVRGGFPVQGGGSQPHRHQGPSTTLYGARLATQAPQNRMLGPRSLAMQNSILRYPSRPRVPLNQAPPMPRRYYPRPTPPQRTPTTRAAVPGRPAPRAPEAKKPVTKPTSLILLSDSDDEIEMIVPEKQSVKTPIAQNKKTPQVNKKTPTSPRPKSKPVVTSEITVSKPNDLLSPQMLQRMSQGGISITPVKPAASKQKSPETAQGTKLVVVVNETGSHYALALPNGSKLILTPEQVAQIRASNGGKLVL